MAEPSYSRNELVSELTSYYEFLTRLFLPPEVVQHPPEGGWEHITPDFVKSFCLGKNDTVAADEVYSLRQPYQGGPLGSVDGLRGRHRCRFHRRRRPEPAHQVRRRVALRALRRQYLDRTLPPHVFVYATIPSGRDGHYILIDTERGTIVLADPQTGPKPTRLSDPQAPDEEAWRRFQTYTFHEFFAMAKEKFKKFEMTAMNRKQIYYTTRDTPHAQIYREEGVFTKRYDRERCMNRLDEYQEQKDRESRQNRGEEEPASASAERHIHDVSVSSGAES
ncbi:hypothetical protein CLIM01_10615 [Colletotrichum limetticola]|uniref:Peptidase C58 YopT-type domain-containing protein n=1 Tax=Colletotrichum limetticola TaxID=1209924 RepID=A0ABQ9PJP9_9PEZI|nr:hypothetical protein CLIM01_10615 [Colletotrichum limetticola]